jgi:hypothetical protein
MDRIGSVALAKKLDRIDFSDPIVPTPAHITHKKYVLVRQKLTVGKIEKR